MVLGPARRSIAVTGLQALSMRRRVVIHNHFVRDAVEVTPEIEAKVRERQSSLRNEFQNLHYERLRLEKEARIEKRAGNLEREKVLWALA